MPYDHFVCTWLTQKSTKEFIVNEFMCVDITFKFDKTHLVSVNAPLGALGGDIVLINICEPNIYVKSQGKCD